MARYMWRDAKSVLRGDGIEEVIIPIVNGFDLERLAMEAQRGTYAVVEWLLTELGRWTELERVCGLSVTPDGAGVVANLEMRQPGKQVEAWLREHKVGKYAEQLSGGVAFSDSTYIEGGTIMLLSERSLSQEKFSDTHKPWWVENPDLLKDEAI